MMHPNFYHWHGRAELKPDPALLTARWNAAVQSAASLPSGRAVSLLCIALFPTVKGEFPPQFTAELVKLEPTFPPDQNSELLRVMATAAIYSVMEKSSVEADAIALGCQAARFLGQRVQPICNELQHRAEEYLSSESKRVRPAFRTTGKLAQLEEKAAQEGWQDDPQATKVLGEAILELNGKLQQISEENQFVWWLLGRRSSLLNEIRKGLTAKQYALAAAKEAAERVSLLPPPRSIEFLLDEAIAQCGDASNPPEPLQALIDGTRLDRPGVEERGNPGNELTPITRLLGMRQPGNKLDAKAIQAVGLPHKFKIQPSEAAAQYLRELMFLRALTQLD